jgi:hypothetical protein
MLTAEKIAAMRVSLSTFTGYLVVEVESYRQDVGKLLDALETAEAEARGEAASLRHTLAIIGAERAAALARAVVAEASHKAASSILAGWRHKAQRMERERDDLALTLANEREEGAGPSEGWEYADETWWGPGYAVTRFNRGGGWQLCAIGTDGSPTEAPIPNPSWHTARDGMKEGAAMLAADAAIKAGGPS